MDMPDINEAFEETIDNRVKANMVCQQLKQRDHVWSDLIPFQKRIGAKGKELGVYGMYYIPEDRFLAFGQGIIYDRIDAHWTTFSNDGLGTKHQFTHVGQKMHRYDPNPDNWMIQYVVIEDKDTCKTYERNCMIEHDTKYNGLNESYGENS